MRRARSLARARRSPASSLRSCSRRRRLGRRPPARQLLDQPPRRRSGSRATASTLRYVLDQAEIPTFQERGDSQARRCSRASGPRSRAASRVVVDGRAVALRELPGARLSLPPARAACSSTRVELALTRAARRRRVGSRSARRDVPRPRRLEGDRRAAGRGHRRALDGALGRPDQRPAQLPAGHAVEPARPAHGDASRSRPGGGTLTAPRPAEPGDGRARDDHDQPRRSDGLRRRVRATPPPAAASLLLLLLAAFGWGALHALSPGHGKAMVAAYLSARAAPRGTRSALGATVTITHTIGVFALGFVTLLLSQYILPEDLYPWLNLVSGLLVRGDRRERAALAAACAADGSCARARPCAHARHAHATVTRTRTIMRTRTITTTAITATATSRPTT